MTKVECFGRLVRDPEIKETTNSRIATFSVACDVAGGRDEKGVAFIQWSAWPPMADQIEKLRKGDPVWVSGFCRTRKYTDKQGTEKSILEFVPYFISGVQREEQKKKGKEESTEDNPKKPAVDTEDDVPF